MNRNHLRPLGCAIIAFGTLLAVTESFAQCPQARRMGGAENFRRHPRVKVDTGAFPNDGNELGSIWVAGAKAINTGGPHFENDESCSAVGEQGWWKTGTKFLEGFSGVEGFVASPRCRFTNCPPDGSSLMTVVEDRSPDGSDAGFIAYLVRESPAGRRWYDHARTEKMKRGHVTTHEFLSFPRPVIRSSVNRSNGRSVTVEFDHVAGHAHVMPVEGQTANDEGQAIASFDLLTASATGDPGRERMHWSPVASVAFEHAGEKAHEIDMPSCDPSATAGLKQWIAVGVTYVDGVESRLVGRAVEAGCLPTNSGAGS